MFVVFRPGLSAWFQRDDFYWIFMGRQGAQRGWWSALLAATPQGTWRPLTDGLFFTVFGELFGLNARPYRELVFATYAVDVILLGTLASRLGAGVFESLLAAVFFCVHEGLAVPMGWMCSYNQLVAITCILASLLCWKSYCDHGGGWRYAALLVLQALGVLALEVHIMFPLMAAIYVLSFEPRARWRARALQIAPLAAVAAAWAILHVVHAPPAHDGVYRPHIGLSILQTLWHYWRWTVLPLGRVDAWYVPAAAALASAAFAVWSLSQGDRRPAFFVGLYVVTLMPALTLRDHVVPNVVAAPEGAFAMLLAAAAAHLWRSGWVTRLVAAAVSVSFVVIMGLAAHRSCEWWSRRSASLEPVFTKLAAVRAQDRTSVLQLTDVDDEFVELTMFDDALFRVGFGPACVVLNDHADRALKLPAGTVCRDRHDDPNVPVRVLSARALALP
jgi:hypothetical protein